MTTTFNPSNKHFTAIRSANKQEWKQQRLFVLTATSAAKLYLRPTPATYRDIIDDKRNPKELGRSKAFDHGHEREPEIIKITAEKLGLNLLQNEQLWVNAKDTRFGATPDGMGYKNVVDEKKGEEVPTFDGTLVECKTSNTRFGGKSFEDMERRPFRYFEKDDNGDYIETTTGEKFDGEIPGIYYGQMLWQRVVAGGNVRNQSNVTYYCMETHEDFDPNTYEISVLKVEFTKDEINDIIGEAEDFFNSDTDFQEAQEELDKYIEIVGRAAAFKKHYEAEEEKAKNKIRELTGAGYAEQAYGSVQGKITASYEYRKTLDKEKVEKLHPGLLDECTYLKESSRPTLRITPSKDLKKKIAEDVNAQLGVNPDKKTEVK